jgi:nucleotide-binding universal stress UspA family protein
VDLPLVVGVDGSEPSLRAVDWAADEAALRGLLLRPVYASLWERYEGAALAGDLGKPSEQVMAEDIVRVGAQRARLRQTDVEISTAVLPEEPEYALVREGRHASAVVLGTRGRSGLVEMLLGSVSLTVAAHADCPVIVLRGSFRSTARAKCRSARFRANTSSAASAVTSPATVPPTATTVHMASTIQASTMSSFRRSGLFRHRHSRFLAYLPLGIGPHLLVAVVTRPKVTAATVPHRRRDQSGLERADARTRTPGDGAGRGASAHRNGPTPRHGRSGRRHLWMHIDPYAVTRRRIAV